MKRMRVAVDAGHGGGDSGAVGPSGVAEKTITLQLAHGIAARLAAAGCPVLCTRHHDVRVSLAERVAMANTWGADLFLSLHCNAFSSPDPEGFEVWTSPGMTAADACATAILEEVMALGYHHRGRYDWSDGDPDKEARFYVLWHTHMPAVLVEYGFISNPREEALLQRGDFQRDVENATVRGVQRWWAKLQLAARPENAVGG